MVKGVNYPIYSGRRAHQGAYYHIQSYLNPDVSREGGGTTITVSRAVAEAIAPKGWSSNGHAYNINHIRWDGIDYRDPVTHKDKSITLAGFDHRDMDARKDKGPKLAAINYFPSAKGTTHRLLILKEELVNLANYFGVPPEFLNDANFAYDPSKRFCPSEAWIQPRWGELTDPSWKEALLLWILKRDPLNYPLPRPNVIRNWQTWPNGLIGIAGIPQLGKFSPGEKRIATGTQIFQDSEGRPQVYFDYSGKIIACYGFNWFPNTKRLSFNYLDTKFSGETYERWQFERVLGPDPSLMEYHFTKIAKNSGFELGNTEKFSLLLNLQKGRMKIGAVYKFEIRRVVEIDERTDQKKHQLFIEGFDSKGQPVGSAVVGLPDGILFRMSVTLKLEKENKEKK